MKRDKEESIVKLKIGNQYRRMLDFKNKHDLKVHPLKTLLEWAEYIIVERNGYCPCSSDRPRCPCEKALSEVKENGKCFCGKFFSPKKFEEIWGEYLKIMEEFDDRNRNN
jgi:ferredoxin-thioredoxin reductase catalytic subunit